MPGKGVTTSSASALGPACGPPLLHSVRKPLCLKMHIDLTDNEEHKRTEDEGWGFFNYPVSSKYNFGIYTTVTIKSNKCLKSEEKQVRLFKEYVKWS